MQHERDPVNCDMADLLQSDKDQDQDQERRTTIEKTDNEYVFILDSVFTKSECGNLIESSETYGYGYTHYRQGYRGNLRLQTNDTRLAEELWTRIEKYIPTTMTDTDGTKWNVTGLNNRFRWSKYEEGTHFNKHVDYIYKQDENHKSFFTVNMYLNDDFDNGHTRFFNSNMRYAEPYKTIEPRPGRALIFAQPDTMYLIHDGEIVNDGIKYLLRTDVMYEKQE